ncbi:carboxypeptidase B1-like [Musca autumnalis]|uniref:carboxypeptidase B1-like n=1 Tax=Musca autumnalis TaxID=221902 RepID=UPI003CED8C26
MRGALQFVYILVFGILSFESIQGKNITHHHLSYEGYKIVDIFLDSSEQYKTFRETFHKSLDVIGQSKQPYSIRVLLEPHKLAAVKKYLKKNNLKFAIINDNVATSVRAEKVFQRTSRSVINNDAIDFHSYQRFDVINNYLDKLAAEFPQQVDTVELGKSYEGRSLKAIHIREKRDDAVQQKPLILIDAGIHAREWISHATALYVIQQLVENSTFYQRELEMYDWLIWPVVNPDGYEYTHENERFWRKTRQPDPEGFSSCVGVDLNRNFDFYWGYVGSSFDPCDIDYHGPEPFSEPEAVALRELLFKVNSTCKMYLTLHSYGNYLLYPWGYDNILPPNWHYLDAVARAGLETIRNTSGTFYTAGSSAHTLYPASGASDDFAYGVANIPVVLCMELPSGGNGFDPPADRILPLVTETWRGIRAMALEVREYPLRNNATSITTNLLFAIVMLLLTKLLLI